MVSLRFTLGYEYYAAPRLFYEVPKGARRPRHYMAPSQPPPAPSLKRRGNNGTPTASSSALRRPSLTEGRGPGIRIRGRC